jgi:phosphomannomutase
VKSHQFHKTVLREYDIRGIVGETIHEADAAAIGRSFGTMIRNAGGKTVAVGYDGRLSSPKLEAALVEGLTEVGLQVTRIGLGPTPMLYFATYFLPADAGIMVTGSHNPPTHNGFKMLMLKKPFFGAQIQELGRISAAGTQAHEGGSVQDRPVFNAYIDRMVKDYDGTREMNVAWDAGNGAAGEAMRALTARLPGRHHLLYADIDGTFPNHHPDPTVPKNLEALRETVLREKCDLGIAFDGDGDRIGVIDGQGRILWGDQLVALLARDVLKTHPGATIIADVKASKMLFDEVARIGGKPLMWKTGHSLIKSKMAETGSPLAGEMSGHIFFADRYYGYDDALYVATRFLGFASRASESVAAMRDSLPQAINTPELRFDCDDSAKFGIVQKARDALKAKGANVDDVDGVRVTTPDGWWLLRASNTQAVLVARAEAADAAKLERVKAELLAALRGAGMDLPSLDATGGHH